MKDRIKNIDVKSSEMKTNRVNMRLICRDWIE